MKTFILSLFLITGFAQQNDEMELFSRDFNAIVDIFEENAIPYIEKFAQLQSQPLSDQLSALDSVARERFIHTMVAIHKTNLHKLRKEMFETMTNDLAPKYKSGDRKKLVTDLAFAYKTQFLFLDYLFYEQCVMEIEKLK